MTEEPHNLVLEHLRHIRASLDALHTEVREVKDRLSGIDLRMASFSCDLAGVSEADARMQVRMDRFSDGIARLNRRLEIDEALSPLPLH